MHASVFLPRTGAYGRPSVFQKLGSQLQGRFTGRANHALSLKVVSQIVKNEEKENGKEKHYKEMQRN